AASITIEVTKGFEFKPLREVVTLAPGKIALRFALERWVDLRKEGWYSGDIRAHFLTPHGALLEAAAEDLAVVNLLAFELNRIDKRTRAHPGIFNILAFSGQRPALEMPGHTLVVNTFNRSEVLGNLSLLNCHRVVYPLTINAWQVGQWTLWDWCDQCHRKSGLVVSERLRMRGGTEGCEILAALILGKIDAVEESEAIAWHRLLNCGFRVPLVGASAKDCNGVILGRRRTYARLRPGEEFSYKSWIEAVR